MSQKQWNCYGLCSRRCLFRIFFVIGIIGICLIIARNQFVSDDRLKLIPIDSNPVKLPAEIQAEQPITVANGEQITVGEVQLIPDTFYKFQVEYNWGDYRERRFPSFGIDTEMFQYDPIRLGQQNNQWRVLSHYFRAPREKKNVNIQFASTKLFSSLIKSEQYRNLTITPAYLLNNTLRQKENFGNIYSGGHLNVSKGPLVGDFLPLGKLEQIDRSYQTKDQTKKATYYFKPLEQDYDGIEAEKMLIPLTQESDLRPLFESRLHYSTQHNTRCWVFTKTSRLVLRFEFRPIRILENGEYRQLPPLPFSPQKIWFTVYSRFPEGKEVKRSPAVEISHNGTSWKKVKNTDPYPEQEFKAALPETERSVFYIRLTLDGLPEGTLTTFHEFRFTATFPNDDYAGWGKHHFFDILPPKRSELQEVKTEQQIFPLFQATNSFYFLCRNDSDKSWQPKFHAVHQYFYSASANINMPENENEKKRLEFRAAGNTSEVFDDISCHWNVINSPDGKVPPHSERIAVYSVETGKLRASSHQQFGPFISDTLETEFDVEQYRLITPHLNPFPPRTWVE